MTVPIPLSQREQQVLELLMQGLSRKQIAQLLQLSVKTVEKHKQAIYYKWQVRDITSMIRVALRTGAVSVESFLFCNIGENTQHEPPSHITTRAHTH